jgi:signal transduction histidine kinase
MQTWYANKFTEAGTITVDASEQMEHVVVTDSGIGIEEVSNI